MVENLNWEYLEKTYHLKNDKYVQDVILLQRLQSDKHYPIILYPQLLREQLSKKFMVGQVGVLLKDKNHIYLHDFLNVAKSLNLKGDDWQFLVHPFNPNDATVPSIREIPTERTEVYKTRNWGCLIPFIIQALLFTLPAFFVSPNDPGLGIIVAILNQLLMRSGREEQALLTTIAGLIVALMMIISQISDLFSTIKSTFGL